MNTIIATDNSHLKQLIQEHIKKYGNQCDLNHIDTSQITDMSYVFYMSQFNGNISTWNTGNVINISYMFCGSLFAGDIRMWNINYLENSEFMFFNCKNQLNPPWANLSKKRIEEYRNSLALVQEIEQSLSHKNEVKPKIKI